MAPGAACNAATAWAAGHTYVAVLSPCSSGVNSCWDYATPAEARHAKLYGGAEKCEACPGGWQTSPGANNGCARCPSGWASSAGDAAGCYLCPAGKVAADSALSCAELLFSGHDYWEATSCSVTTTPSCAWRAPRRRPRLAQFLGAAAGPPKEKGGR